MNRETWRTVNGWGMYQVSNLGRVRSLKHGAVRILRPVASGDGYLQVTFSQLGRPKKFLVSRLVAEAFLPNPEGKSSVNHLDFDITNNRVSNLEWATIEENLFHAVVNESRIKKLTNAQVAEIRELKGKLSQVVIAAKFGVNRSHIGAIHRGEARRIRSTE